MNSSAWLDWIRPSSTRHLPYEWVSMISMNWNLVWRVTMVRAMACMCPSTGVVVSKNHLYWSVAIGRSAGGGDDGGPGRLVQEGPAVVHEDASREGDHRGPGGPELLDEVVGRHLGLEHVAAGEHVDRGVAILGPGVDRQMRLGDDDDSADAKRVELVKDNVDDGGLSPLGRLHHGRLHGVQTVKGFRVAVEQLEQQVTPQCLHSFPPPRFCPAFFLLAGFFCTVGLFFFHCKEKMGFWATPAAPRALSDGSTRALARRPRALARRPRARRAAPRATFRLRSWAEPLR